MSDTSMVDAAIIARLLNDATLQALMPDGVYWDVAAHGKTRFVIVSQVIHEDVPQIASTAYERITYLVKAVELATAGANILAAANRIHQLLHDVVVECDGLQPDDDPSDRAAAGNRTR